MVAAAAIGARRTGSDDKDMGELSDDILRTVVEKHGFFHENMRIPIAATPEDNSPLHTMAELLAALELTRLEPLVGSESLVELSELGRANILARLKDLGVSKVGERQAVANKAKSIVDNLTGLWD